jgi:hypothetical protein
MASVSNPVLLPRTGADLCETQISVEGFPMRKTLFLTVFALATVSWAAAQQPGSAGQNQPQTGPQSDAEGPAANTQVMEGCLSGTNPNYTIKSNAGKTYKLNFPPEADVSPLQPHVGEAIVVLGDINDSGTSNQASIDVAKIGRGTGNCPSSAPGGAQAPSKQ